MDSNCLMDWTFAVGKEESPSLAAHNKVLVQEVIHRFEMVRANVNESICLILLDACPGTVMQSPASSLITRPPSNGHVEVMLSWKENKCICWFTVDMAFPELQTQCQLTNKRVKNWYVQAWLIYLKTFISSFDFWSHNWTSGATPNFASKRQCCRCCRWSWQSPTCSCWSLRWNEPLTMVVMLFNLPSLKLT